MTWVPRVESRFSPRLGSLRARIAEVGLPKREIAACVGVDTSAFSALLNGRRTLSADLERRIRLVLEVEGRAREAGRAAAARERQRAAAELGLEPPVRRRRGRWAGLEPGSDGAGAGVSPVGLKEGS